MDRSLDLWNGLFHDGVITAMAGPVPGDVTVTIQPGLGNRKFFADPGENFVVVLKGCTGRPIRYEELEASVTRWWEEWKRYWETQRQSK